MLVHHACTAWCTAVCLRRGQKLGLDVAIRFFPCAAHKSVERERLCAADFIANTSANPPMRSDFMGKLEAALKVWCVRARVSCMLELQLPSVGQALQLWGSACIQARAMLGRGMGQATRHCTCAAAV